ncbi:DUF4291 domain-containing protein [uncultured Psychroserpens sp.]|uniref:DUF4291 domain-containing protein n=1 Tax=uncultured Psychroserpens sp. TaxID=255436 RepID=UPI00262C82A8|nr:DUF4291 domain-containing protein [uncultured Psychroserpens sp.]
MKLNIKPYIEQQKVWPKTGHHIMAQYDESEIIVYQSYRPEIGNFASDNNYFGGAFSLNRMTWIKPNFLWMMYRNGWATKEGQETVLAIHLRRDAFERYLNQAVYSSYQSDLYETREHWQEEVQNSSIRLQWDPDHDPYGAKLERRAIQIGIRGNEVKQYAKDDILEIEDITPFVKEQYNHLLNNQLDKLMVPEEHPLILDSESLKQQLRLQ